MDDLQNKSDEELISIMKSAAANQHVPGSRYHQARIELEGRAAKSRAEHSDLTNIAKSVLLAISKSNKSDSTGVKFMPIEILEHQFGERHMPKVRQALKELMDRDLVEELEDYPTVFKLTPFGVNQLDEMSRSNGVTIENVSHSNIAHNSTNVTQTISYDNLPEDIKSHLEDLQIAAKEQNAEGMKVAFNYIADNAVDVASAITTGNLAV